MLARCVSLIKEEVGDMGSVLGGLYMKGTHGGVVCICRNQQTLRGAVPPWVHKAPDCQSIVRYRK